MKILIIGGNRFVGLRLTLALDAQPGHELHVLNRTGQVAHSKNAVVHKGNRSDLERVFLDRDWDVVVDFACFNASEARESAKFFKKIGRYIFISTNSVYSTSSPRKESDFDPGTWVIHDQPSEEEKKNLYQFGKRQAEAVFTQEAKFPVASIRLPFILGPDDYTRRLLFHYERVLKGQPIYMANPKARISVVESEDSANFLKWSLTQTFTGPLNFASPESIALNELLTMIEKTTGRKALLMDRETPENHSPYGVSEDAVVDVQKVIALGFTPKPLKTWLPPLIASLDPDGIKEADTNASRRLH